MVEPTMDGAQRLRHPPEKRRATRFIKQLREKSYYPTFRAVVNLLTLLGYIAGASALVTFVMQLSGNSSRSYFALGIGVLILVFTQLSRKMAFMVADGCDALVSLAERQNL